MPERSLLASTKASRSLYGTLGVCICALPEVGQAVRVKAQAGGHLVHYVLRGVATGLQAQQSGRS